MECSNKTNAHRPPAGPSYGHTHTHTHTRAHKWHAHRRVQLFLSGCLPVPAWLLVCLACMCFIQNTAAVNRSFGWSVGRSVVCVYRQPQQWSTQHNTPQRNAGQDWKETQASITSRGQKDGGPAGRLRGRVERERRRARVNACLCLHLASCLPLAPPLPVCLSVCLCVRLY